MSLQATPSPFYVVRTADLMVPARIPDPEAFAGKKVLPGDTPGFEDLDAMCRAVIAAHPDVLGPLAAFEFDLYWKATGSKKSGKLTCGTCTKLGGRAARYTTGHFGIDIMADNCRQFEMTRYDLQALMFHELCHAGTDDALRPKSKPHDLEVFIAEVERYGLWTFDLKAAAPAFEQASLFTAATAA